MSSSCLFPLDAHMVSCPTWSENLGRTLTDRWHINEGLCATCQVSPVPKSGKAVHFPQSNSTPPVKNSIFNSWKLNLWMIPLSNPHPFFEVFNSNDFTTDVNKVINPLRCNWKNWIWIWIISTWKNKLLKYFEQGRQYFI